MLSQLRQQELSTALRLLPADVVKQIGKRHPLLIPPFTNDALRRAVKDYLAGGAKTATPEWSKFVLWTDQANQKPNKAACD